MTLGEYLTPLLRNNLRIEAERERENYKSKHNGQLFFNLQEHQKSKKKGCTFATLFVLIIIIFNFFFLPNHVSEFNCEISLTTIGLILVCPDKYWQAIATQNIFDFHL